MARTVIDVDDLMRSAQVGPPEDDTTERILDAAAELFATRGIRRCSVEEIAERSGVGRTTVYRRFEHRNQIVQAVLARETRRFFAGILAATAGIEVFEDLVVEAFLCGLDTARSSLLTDMVRTQPELRSLFTVDAEPLIAAATGFLVVAFGPVPDDDRARVAGVAELLVRLAVSMVVSGPGGLPATRDDASRRALHELLDPLLTPLAELRG